MGFFDIFKSSRSSSESSSHTSGGMAALTASRTGGYDRRDVLLKADAMTTEIIALEEALNAKEQGKPYTLPEKAEDKPLKTVRKGGFSEEDVDAYISDLEKKIAELRAQL